MWQVKIFSLENFWASVLLHLIVVAIMITSFSGEPEKIIAPEKMKIFDVDLTNVKITTQKTRAPSGEVADSKPQGQGDKSKSKVEPEKVVRRVAVQRDKAPIVRNVNVSVVDALRIAMTRCWQIDTAIPNLHEYNVAVQLSMERGGFISSIFIENESFFDDGGTGAYVLDTVRQAIAACQPFSMLPDEVYDDWKSVKLNFFPSKGAVN
ncbi:MAG: hypothetical protein LBB23_01415 [Rickettsiales bacterium]|jgi:hypothetical protein|nr:hypothetical protein [Rickettsiales bacterium]